VSKTSEQPVIQKIISYYEDRDITVKVTDNLNDLDEFVINNDEVDEIASQGGCTVVIVDDFFSKRDMENEFLCSLFSRGRHKNIHTFAITQDFFDFGDTLRKNASDLILFPHDQMDVLYRHSWCNSVEEFEDSKHFRKILQKVFIPDKGMKRPFLWIVIREIEPCRRRVMRVRRGIKGIQKKFLSSH